LHRIKKCIVLALLGLFCLGFSVLYSVEYQVHKVRKGDTLYSLSKRYGVTVNDLMKLNKLADSRLSIGQALKIKPETKKPIPKVKPKVTETIEPKPVVKPKPASAVTTEQETPAETTSLPIPENLPAEYFHEVLSKENLYRIALNANITLVELLKFNNFPDAHVIIKPGQRLVIKDPALFKSNQSTSSTVQDSEGQNEEVSEQPANGDSIVIEKVYIVQRKDTLFKIARENNMTVVQLKRLNNLTDNSIKYGQKLYIIAPKDKVVNEIVPVIVTEEELKTKLKLRTDLIMPVDGKVISEYGIRNGRPHKGTDLGAANGMPVYAVLDGTVVYAGLQGNYGNVVVIEHPDFIMTVYGHNEKNLVSVGDIVKQGQIIATTGSTGNATTPHVHFEYRIKGKAINPRKVLPIGQ
jgi:murein DD-endopeptidase MepM/ murein hydrolase activator NlpD